MVNERMDNVKKIISLVLVAVLTVSAVVGCSGGTTKSTSTSSGGGSATSETVKK